MGPAPSGNSLLILLPTPSTPIPGPVFRPTTHSFTGTHMQLNYSWHHGFSPSSCLFFHLTSPLFFLFSSSSIIHPILLSCPSHPFFYVFILFSTSLSGSGYYPPNSRPSRFLLVEYSQFLYHRFWYPLFFSRPAELLWPDGAQYLFIPVGLGPSY